MRLRAEVKNECWSMDFASDELYDSLRIINHRLHSILNWQTPAAFAARCRGRRRSCTASGSPLPAHPSQHTQIVKTLP